ncbi:MAG: oligoendopeptidase F [Desulfobacteraceae bacterium]|nr:oligoendopeptidase F [Desulfobacteraceae bacterium]
MNNTGPRTRQDITKKDCWDLTSLFSSKKDWETLYKKLESRIPDYEQFKDQLHKSYECFKRCLDFDHGIIRDLEKIYTYAHLKNDEDKTNAPANELFQRAMNLHTRICDSASFIIPQIQAIPKKTMAAFLTQDSISDYRFYLEQIIRNNPHTRSVEVEQILAMAGESLTAPQQIFGQLNNADLDFGSLTDPQKQTQPLTHGNFILFLNHKDRNFRKKVFTQYYGVYESHKHTIAAALAGSVKKDLFYAKVKQFPDSRQAALFKNNIGSCVYDNLILNVKKDLSPLYSYLDFRKKSLGLDKLHIYDTYVPIINDIKFHMSYEEAVSTCIKALAPLGEEYCKVLEKGLTQGWVDRYENKGKCSGAYSSGCYDSSPYILLNYEEKSIDSLFTLIHEAGHSMHSYYSRKHQPYASHDYTIFVAEVASTLNENLLGQYLLKKYEDDPRMKAYILNREIENIRATFFRQTMFAEFENHIHGLATRNKALTLETMTKKYRQLLEDYFGDHMVIDEPLCLECLRIPHFYSAFYVYQYATGISAALAISKKIQTLGQTAVDEYLSFLKLGGSMFPIDELKTAGVDMSSPAPILETISYFGTLVNNLENLWNTNLKP